MALKTDRSYISDPKLIPRIKSFLRGKSTDVFTQPASVVQHLQDTYSDYARKKKNAFLQVVYKALQIAQSEMSVTELSPGGTKRKKQDSSSDSDPEGLLEYKNTNSMNIAMRNLYKNNTAHALRMSTPEELPKKQKMKGSSPKQSKSNRQQGKTSAVSGAVVGEREDSGVDQSSGLEGVQEDRDLDNSVDSGVLKAEATQCVCRCTCGAKDGIIKADSVIFSDTIVLSETPSTTLREGIQKGSLEDSLNRPYILGDFKEKKKDRKGKVKTPQEVGRLSDTELGDLNPTIPTSTLKDIGGNESLLINTLRVVGPGNAVVSLCMKMHANKPQNLLCMEFMELGEILDQFSDADVWRFRGFPPLPGILFHGPIGSGKSFLAECSAGYLGIPLLRPSVTSLISGVSGDSEQRIRDLFKQAMRCAPCVLFLENIQSLAPKQESPGAAMVDRVITQLCRSIDELCSRPENILLIASTNRIDLVHESLRVPGRFTEKLFPMPGEKARESILQKLCARFSVFSDCSVKTLAKLTPGFVAGDLHNLVVQAASYGFQRVRHHYRNQEHPAEKLVKCYQPPSHLRGKEITISDEDRSMLNITEEDFKKALQKAEPAALREGFATVPTTTWADVGALQHVRAQLEDSILSWIKKPERAAACCLPTNTGTILIGPPGCGKTLVAKAMANEAGLNFMNIKGPELLDKYVGESERGLRRVFEKAQMCAPCLIFFDEMDALCSNRQNKEGGSVNKSVTNQLLALMDGCGERNQVYVMGATNIIESIDPALQRPGRFDRKIFIGLPNAEGRLEILKALTKNGTDPKLKDCDLNYFAQATEGFSGADLKQLVHEASYIVFREDSDQNDEVLIAGSHFSQALDIVKPSVQAKDVKKYRRVALQTELK